MRYLFHSGLEKQKNNFFVYIDYVLYFYFSGLSLRKAAADDRLSSYVLLNESIYLYRTDGFRNSNLQRNYYYLQLKKEEELKNSLY